MQICRLFNICRRQRRKFFVIILLSMLSSMIVSRRSKSKETTSMISNSSLPLLTTAQDLHTNCPIVSFATHTTLPKVSVVNQKALPSAEWLETLKPICSSESSKHKLGFSVSCSQPLLTMFTTMDISNTNRIQIHYNTIMNWAWLGPCAKQILFSETNSSPVALFALRNGWTVEKIPFKLFDIPVIKSMYLSSFKLSSTPLYLYANADILFDHGLIKTTLALLCALKREANKTKDSDYLQHSIFDKGIFAVGKRINVPLTQIKSVLPDALPVFQKTIRVFREHAEDYFMTTSGPITRLQSSTTLMTSAVNNSTGHFPWEKIPKFVIGRPGYDNWLVAQALRYNVTLAIDLSRTVMAVHQTGADGVRSGFTALGNWRTLHFNIKLAGGRKYAFGQGVTTCMPWFSFPTRNKNIRFIMRLHRKPICTLYVNKTGKPVKHRKVKNKGATKLKQISSGKNT